MTKIGITTATIGTLGAALALAGAAAAAPTPEGSSAAR
jgi:hypothetical protein